MEARAFASKEPRIDRQYLKHQRNRHHPITNPTLTNHTTKTTTKPTTNPPTHPSTNRTTNPITNPTRRDRRHWHQALRLPLGRRAGDPTHDAGAAESDGRLRLDERGQGDHGDQQVGVWIRRGCWLGGCDRGCVYGRVGGIAGVKGRVGRKLWGKERRGGGWGVGGGGAQSDRASPSSSG
jgi:hypothetical protein